MILMHDITRGGNPILGQVVESLTFPLADEYKELADEMVQYLINSQDPEIAEEHQLRASVGLAVPQVGRSIQMAALLAPSDKGEIIFRKVSINPKVISELVRKACLTGGEGCLSMDKDIEGYVPHPGKLKIHYYTVNGEEKIIRLRDYPTIVVSHEIDHLNGHLFYDRISRQNPFDLVEGTIVIS